MRVWLENLLDISWPFPYPKKNASELRELYQATYGDRLRVKFIHVTILPPFTFDNPHTFDHIQEILQTIQDFSQPFYYGDPSVFHNAEIKNSRRILYVPINTINTAPLHDVYEKLLLQFRSHVIFKSNDFKKNEVPAFLPHVTLSYKFNGDPRLFVPPHDPIYLPAPQLLAESGPGLWERVTV